MAPQEPFHRTVLRAVLVVLRVVRRAVADLPAAQADRAGSCWRCSSRSRCRAPSTSCTAGCAAGWRSPLSYLGLLLVPLALIAVITPSIVNGVEDLANKAPDYAAQLRDQINSNPRLRKLDAQYGVSDRIVQEAQKLPNRLGDAASILTNLGIGIVNSVFAAVTILILSIFMVGGGRRWVDQALETQPPERAERIRRALDRSANAVGSYVAGCWCRRRSPGCRRSSCC